MDKFDKSLNNTKKLLETREQYLRELEKLNNEKIKLEAKCKQLEDEIKRLTLAKINLIKSQYFE